MDTLDALRLYVSIAESGSLVAAARQQGVATSTVTLALQQLEERAATRLVTRTTRRLAFTHEGEAFLAEARRVLAQWNAALEIVTPNGQLEGPIRITATSDFGRTRLLPLLDRFLERHPSVQLEVHLADGVVDMVEHNIDLALRSGPLADSTLRSRLLIASKRIICAAPLYWRSRGKPERPEELSAHNCLILQRPGVPFASWPFVVDGKPVSVRVSGDRAANDGNVLRHWAMLGHGVMIKNIWEIRREIEEGALEVVLEEFAPPHVDLHAVTTGGAPNRRVTALVDFLAAALRSQH